MKEFVTAIKAAEAEDDESIEFAIDGHLLRCYRPTPAQFAIAASHLSERRPIQERMAAIIDFFVYVMDEDSQHYVENRLLDRTDPFGLDEINNIMEWMVEEWSARPLPSESGSAPSPSRGGRKSTRTTTRPTSSPTASTGT